jgi:transcriptional regulator with XRE-family HTH domain
VANKRLEDRTERGIALGERILRYRTGRNLLQREVAEGAEIPYGSYVAYERGENEWPPVEYVYRLARFFGTTMEELLDLEPLAPIANGANTAEVERLRERLATYQYVDVAMPYMERAHRDLGRMIDELHG